MVMGRSRPGSPSSSGMLVGSLGGGVVALPVPVPNPASGFGFGGGVEEGGEEAMVLDTEWLF
jgi:hypothetical protein